MLQTKETLRTILDSNPASDFPHSKPVSIRINGSEQIPLDIAFVDNTGDTLELNLRIAPQIETLKLSMGGSLSVGPGEEIFDKTPVVGIVQTDVSCHPVLTPSEALKLAIQLLSAAFQAKGDPNLKA